MWGEESKERWGEKGIFQLVDFWVFYFNLIRVDLFLYVLYFDV